MRPRNLRRAHPTSQARLVSVAAIDYLQNIGLAPIAAYEHELLAYATEALQSVRGLRLIGTAANKASVLSFVIAGYEPEKIAAHLDQQGIAARAGHHCALPRPAPIRRRKNRPRFTGVLTTPREKWIHWSGPCIS